MQLVARYDAKSIKKSRNPRDFFILEKITPSSPQKQVEYAKFLFTSFEVSMDILISIIGIFVLLGIAVLFSNNRKAINLRTVFGALAIQII